MTQATARVVETDGMRKNMLWLREHLGTYLATQAQVSQLQAQAEREQADVNIDMRIYNETRKELIIKTFLDEGLGVCYGDHHPSEQVHLTVVKNVGFYSQLNLSTVTKIIPVCASCRLELMRQATLHSRSGHSCEDIDDISVLQALSDKLHESSGEVLDLLLEEWASEQGFPLAIKRTVSADGEVTYTLGSEPIAPLES